MSDMQVQRPATLREWVEKLPEFHLARKQFEALLEVTRAARDLKYPGSRLEKALAALPEDLK